MTTTWMNDKPWQIPVTIIATVIYYCQQNIVGLQVYQMMFIDKPWCTNTSPVL